MNTFLSRFRRAAWLQALALAVLTPSLVLVSGPVRANPTDGRVSAGMAEIGEGLNGHLQIHQHTNRAVINWGTFNISAGELTQFIQPGQNAVMLSKVSQGLSRIDGQLRANGGHILVNTNGIVVGPGGRVDVGGINVLSTLDIDSNQFMRGGPMRFSGNTTAGVTNFGTITSAGGDVILLGNFVDNAGKLGAVNGTVALGAGGDILVGGSGESTISISRGGAGGATGVNNSGTITGAAVEMKAHGNVYALAVNNSGAIRATGGGRKGGRVILSAPGGTINNTGTIVAKKANGDGGDITIDATGGEVNIESGEVRADGSGGGDGGNITILGDTIGVGAPATVSANGANGGSIIIGSPDSTGLINIDGNVEAIGSSGTGGSVGVFGTGSSVINVNGNINASGATQGGSIEARGGTINQGANSVIDAGGGVSGGTVTLNARNVNTLGGIVQATGGVQEGGDVIVTGDAVNLTGDAVIDVSGVRAGGNANIGGGFQGRVDSIPNATTTSVGSGVRITADSSNGNAGTVVVWADGDTLFNGDISASARGAIGNGGLIEVSGKQNLNVRGTVAATSVNGESGMVLFDPGDVVVGNADDAAVDIDSETVNLTLQGGTSVIIATESGDITFLNTGVDNDWHDAIQWSNSNASFGAFASGLINIETHIRTSGKGSINLMAGWTGSEADLLGFGYGAGADPQLFSNALGIPTVEIAWRFFLEAGQFGDRSQLGSVIMGGGSTSRHVVVGSRYGNTNVAGGDLFMLGPQNASGGSLGTSESRYIQLGFRDSGQVFGIRGLYGFDNARIDLNNRLLERPNDPIVAINDPQYYHDVGGDGIFDGVYGINSGGVLDATNSFAIANPGGRTDGHPSQANSPETLIPFQNHFMSSRTGNWWWQQIDGLTPDPQGLGGRAPEWGAGQDTALTGDPTSRADINVAMTGGVLVSPGGRNHNYAQIGHGGNGGGWADEHGLRDGNRNNNLEGQVGRNFQYNAGRDWSGTGIGRLAGVFGNINVLAGVDPTTVRYDPSAAQINLTGVTDNLGGFVKLSPRQTTAPGGSTNQEAGGNSRSYALIGHLGYANFGAVTGDINVTAGGNIDILAGGSSGDYAQIGHSHSGRVVWNPPSNEHAQVRFGYDLSDTDDPNLRKGELFLHANGIDFARGFYPNNTDPINVDGIAGNDPEAGRHDDDFWDIDGDINNDGFLDSDDVTPAPNAGLDTPGPGQIGTPGEHPNGPVHVPALTGVVDKTIYSNIRVNSYGSRGITIRGFSTPDTRLITTDDSRTIGDLYDDFNANEVQDPGEAARLQGEYAFSILSGARGGNSNDDPSDDDGLRTRRDSRYAGIGHGGRGFAIWNDLNTEQVHLRILPQNNTPIGDVDEPGESQANLASESRALNSFGGSARSRGVTFVNMIGDIDVHAHNGGVEVSAGNDSFDYGFIGNGGIDLADYETSNVTFSNITVTGATDLLMLGAATRDVYTGETQRSARSPAQIGHFSPHNIGTQYFGGDIDVNFGGDIIMLGARVGRSPVKIGHQTYESFGQVGGTYDRQEHFVYGPQITESSVTFTGAEVTDSEIIIGFGPDPLAADYLKSYAIDGNTANISVRAGGNVIMTHADPQLAVTQNMYARQQGGNINELRWSETAIGHGGRVTYGVRNNNDNPLYYYADKIGDISVTAGTFDPVLDQLGNPTFDENGAPITALRAGTGDITMQNGSGYHWTTNIGHYFHEAARSNAPNTAENAHKLIGDVNVTAYNNLTLDSSFASANDPVNFVSFIGLPIERNYVRIGHGASLNNLDLATVDDGSLVHGIAASSDVNVMVGNDLNMGWVRTSDGSNNAFREGLEDRIGTAIGQDVNFYGVDEGVNPIGEDDPLLSPSDEVHGGFRASFAQIGHGYTSDVGNDPARPDGFAGDISISVGNDMNVTAGEDAWLVSPVLGDGPVFVDGHPAWVGHGGHQLDSDLKGDISVHVGNNLTLTASQRKQPSFVDGNQDPVGSVGNVAKIGHHSIDLDVIQQSVEGDHSGNIIVAVGNDFTMNGGTVVGDFIDVPTQFAYTQVGHSGPGVNGDKIGDIQVLVGNNFTTNDGVNAPNANAYVMIGNGDWARDGAGFAGHNGTGPGSRAGDISILVGNSIDFDHTLIGHADPAVAAAETTIRSGNTFVGVSRNFPFFDVDPGTADASGNFVARNGSVFATGFYGLNGQLQLYMPQRENNRIELNTRFNEGFIGYLGTPQAGLVNGVGGVSFVDHIGGVFDPTLGPAAGRRDEIYLQPDLWWDATQTATSVGTAGLFPVDLASVQGGSVATVDAPGGVPNLILLSAGVFGDGTALDASALDYQTANGLSGRGHYTIYYDAVEEVGTTVIPPDVGGPVILPPVEPPTPPLPPNPGSPVEPFFLAEPLPFEIPIIAPTLDIFGLLGLVDATKFDAWDRDHEGAFGAGPDSEGFFEGIGLFGLIYGPGGEVSAEEDFEFTTGNAFLDSLGMLAGFQTGEGADEAEEQEKRAARYRTLGKTYLIQYRQLLNTGQANRYNSANVFSGNGL